MFARMYRPGRIARDVLRTGDVDGPNASASTFLTMLTKREESEHANIDVVANRERQPVSERLEALRSRKERRCARKSSQMQELEDRRRNMTAWRTAGIRERLAIVECRLVWRIHILVVLASLDFFVFAQAMAVAFDIRPDAGEPAYLLGGVLGLAVYVLGLFSAHSLKRTSLAFAQAKLTPDDENARRASANLGSVVFVTLLFVVACVASLLIRLEAETNESTSVVVFQMMLPVLAVVIEYLIHDPTHVPSPRRTAVDWWLDRRIDAAENRLVSITRGVEDAHTMVRTLYSYETSILGRELEDRGLMGAPL